VAFGRVVLWGGGAEGRQAVLAWGVLRQNGLGLNRTPRYSLRASGRRFGVLPWRYRGCPLVFSAPYTICEARPNMNTSMNPAGSVLLADDHGLVRHGLQLLIAEVLPQLRVQLAGSLAEAVKALQSQGRFDLVLLDLTLSDVHGLAGLHRLREEFPYVPVVILSAQDDRDTVLAALDAGAMGFIPKSSSASVLIPALKLVLARGIYLPPSAFVDVPPAATPVPAPAAGAATTAPGPAGSPAANPGRTPHSLGLSPRQSEVLYLILQGKPAKLIEREMALSASTVKAHTSAVLRALNVTTRTQAVVAAGRIGLRFDGV